MKARVVLLSTNLARGGAETQVAQLATGLVRRGWAVTVVSLLTPSAFAADLEGAGVPVYSPGMRPGVPDPRAVVRLAALLGRLRPHVLHAHLFHANVLARVLRLLCPVPVVISTIHSLAESARDSASVAARDRVYRFTDALSDVTVCVSQAAASRHIAARAVSVGRLRVIPNGIDTVRHAPDAARREAMRRELDLGSEFTWLAAGRLNWKKDYPTMLRAMAEQDRGVLLIAGAGPLETGLRAKARGLGPRVRFLGARDDVPALMNAADGLLLSSVVEGLPVVLLEAAAAGLPVVATAAGGSGEVVIPGETGFLVAPGDAVAFARAMTQLAGLSAETRASMGRAARRHVLKHFDWSVVLCRVERLYEELLTRAAREELAWM